MRYIAQSLLVVLVSAPCHSFAVISLSRRSTNTNNIRTNKIGPLMSGETHFNAEAASNTEDVQCYLIENDKDGQDDESSGDLTSAKPTVVCTSEPEAYAWYNGLNANQMKPTDGNDSGATECIEGASPRGTPEWECT